MDSFLFKKNLNYSYSSKKAPVNTTSAVLKVKSTDPQKFELFDKEASIYKTILPSFVDNWKKVGETIEFAPRLILSQNEPKSFMIFEDVCNHGFFSEEPSIGLNLEQSKIALQKLAFVHATSVIDLSKVKFIEVLAIALGIKNFSFFAHRNRSTSNNLAKVFSTRTTKWFRVT